MKLFLMFPKVRKKEQCNITLTALIEINLLKINFTVSGYKFGEVLNEKKLCLLLSKDRITAADGT